jgi:hypothetical protein
VKKDTVKEGRKLAGERVDQGQTSHVSKLSAQVESKAYSDS